MFIKVDEDNATLFEIPAGPNGLEYGSHVTTTEPWKVDWSTVLERTFGFLHYRGQEIPPFTLPREATGEMMQPFWIVHWARWYTDPDQKSLGVVTTSDLYVMNDQGKTIDSLRHG